MTLLVLSEAHVASLLTMRDAVDAVDGALRAHAAGAAAFPLRGIVAPPAGFLGSMPGFVGGGTPALGAKLVTFYRDNATAGLPTHHAVIVLFDPPSGVPTALVDGRYITEIRTAAASAVATRALCAGSRVVAILGTGVQARSHIDALAETQDVKQFRVWGRDLAKAEAVAADAAGRGIPAVSNATVRGACVDADVICTVTSAVEPILDTADVRHGAHINAVGACTPVARELSAALMGRARLVSDSQDGAMREAGDIVLAIRDGALPAAPDIAILGDVLAGKTAGRRSRDEITLFKSLGIAIEDLACAALAVERARERGIGEQIAL